MSLPRSCRPGSRKDACEPLAHRLSIRPHLYPLYLMIRFLRQYLSRPRSQMHRSHHAGNRLILGHQIPLISLLPTPDRRVQAAETVLGLSLRRVRYVSRICIFPLLYRAHAHDGKRSAADRAAAAMFVSLKKISVNQVDKGDKVQAKQSRRRRTMVKHCAQKQC